MSAAASTSNQETSSDPWSVPVGGSGGGTYVCCPAGTYLASIVGLFDVGSQAENDRETGRESHVRKLIVVLELARTRPDGRPFILAEKYTFSMNEKAHLSKLVTAITGSKPRDGEQFSVRSINGLPVMVGVGNTTTGDRSYHDVTAISRFPEGLTVPTPTHRPMLWSVATGEAFPDGLEWLPKVYGKTVKALAEESAEARRRRIASAPMTPPPMTYEPVPVLGDDDDIPF